MVLQLLGRDFSPICKGRTSDLEKAKNLQAALASIYPDNIYVVAEIL